MNRDEQKPTILADDHGGIERGNDEAPEQPNAVEAEDWQPSARAVEASKGSALDRRSIGALEQVGRAE